MPNNVQTAQVFRNNSGMQQVTHSKLNSSNTVRYKKTVVNIISIICQQQ